MVGMMDTIQAGRHSIRVLYLDNHLLGVEKPPNMPVQRDSSGDLDLLSACKDYIGGKFSKPGAVYLGLVHRLDRPVGGAMVLARTSKAAARLSQQFAGHTVDKQYLCVLQGELMEPRTLEHWLLKNESTGSSKVAPEGTAGAKLARLETRPLAHVGGLTLAQVRLLTGRSHQIRVQHQGIGLPLWGDARYGRGRPGEQIALWAHSLTLDHPTLHGPVALVSLPPDQGIWREFGNILMELNHE